MDTHVKHEGCNPGHIALVFPKIYLASIYKNEPNVKLC